MGKKESSQACKNCRRAWGDHTAKGQNGASCTVAVKQKGTLAQCTNCFYYVKSNVTYNGMKREALLNHLSNETAFAEYMTGLGEWECQRSEGKRANRGTTRVAAEASHGLSTRKLQGYLWTKALLDEHDEGALFKKGRVTSISHMRKTVQGILREKFVLGAIEVYEDSSMKAVRTHVVQETEAGASEEADTAFASLTSHVQGSCDTDKESGEMQLKGNKRKQDDDTDDMMALWGMSTLIGQNQSSSATRNKSTGEDGEEIKAKSSAKRTKQPKAVLPDVGLSGESAAETASQSGSSASKNLASSWMFSGNLSVSRRPRTTEHSREFDQTEKAIAMVESVRQLVLSSDSFLSVPFSKAQAALDKISLRNTEPLQKMYREACLGENSSHAMELLRRTSQAEVQAKAICNFVSALHDSEASPETLCESVSVARAEGIALPKCADKICLARKVKTLGKTCTSDWTAFYDALRPDGELEPMFDGDSSAIADFQASSLTTTLNLC